MARRAGSPRARRPAESAPAPARPARSTQPRTAAGPASTSPACPGSSSPRSSGSSRRAPDFWERRRQRQAGERRHLRGQAPRRGEAAVQDHEVTLRMAATAGAIAVAVALAGCGLGAGKGTSDVALTVTRDFGTVPVGSASERQRARLADRDAPARAVLPGDHALRRRVRRSRSTGCAEPPRGATGSTTSTGSRPRWARRAPRCIAATGSGGTSTTGAPPTRSRPWSVRSPSRSCTARGGRRLPTTLACASDAGAACKRVAAEFRAIGVPTPTVLLGTGSGSDSLAVVVGTWRDLHGELAATLVEHGPGSSGDLRAVHRPERVLAATARTRPVRSCGRWAPAAA